MISGSIVATTLNHNSGVDKLARQEKIDIDDYSRIINKFLSLSVDLMDYKNRSTKEFLQDHINSF
jgi:hypothetical protein